MKLTELTEIIEDPALVMPVAGVDYEVPPCSAETWLLMQEHQRTVETRIGAELAAGRTVDDIGRESDPTGIDLYRVALGPVYEQLIDAKVSIALLTVCGMTAYLWQLGNHQAAEAVWMSGGKALAAAAAVFDSTTPSDRDGDGESTTPTSTSGSGTTSRKPRKAPAKKAAPRKAAATRSRKSSPTAN